MTTAITTKPQAKSIVSALRRELKALSKGTTDLSHNDCLAVMAKALGFSSWNAWEATLAEGADSKASIPAASLKNSKYPLVNNGEFDFIKPGEEGIPYMGDFTRITGTFEKVEAKGLFSSMYRVTNPKDASPDNSGLSITHEGSETFDDTMTTQMEKGQIVWLGEDGEELTGAIVLVPDDCDDPYYDERLPVRMKLIDAYLEYYAENGVDDSAREGCFDNAEAVLGLWLTEREVEWLLDKLPASSTN